jgi:hypothetical protein
VTMTCESDKMNQYVTVENKHSLLSSSSMWQPCGVVNEYGCFNVFFICFVDCVLSLAMNAMEFSSGLSSLLRTTLLCCC